MADTYEGNGVSFTYAGLTLSPKTIQIPGWTKEEIDITTLENSAAKTKFVAALRDYNKLFMTLNFDVSQIESIPQTNQALVITVPSVGTITYQAEISESDDVSLENDTQPVYRVGFTLTNLSGTSETVPAFST